MEEKGMQCFCKCDCGEVFGLLLLEWGMGCEGMNGLWRVSPRSGMVCQVINWVLCSKFVCCGVVTVLRCSSKSEWFTVFIEWFPLSLIINPFGFELCVKSVTDTLRSRKGVSMSVLLCTFRIRCICVEWSKVYSLLLRIPLGKEARAFRRNGP